MATRDDDAHSKTVALGELNDTLVDDSLLSSSSASSSALTSPEMPETVEEGRQWLANRYELLRMLGAGAMGTVYRAHDHELDEIVALKVLKKELATPEMTARFRREVKLARRVTHANVARTYDIGEHGTSDLRFLTMELIEGEMLGDLLAKKGHLPVDQVIQIAIDLCAGLSAAHGAGVLHRDLKPENVIIAEAPGRGAVITDFGIARSDVVSAESDDPLSRTNENGIVGTPAYMAPEQVEGATDLDARADLYALGVMLYELLTGEMAWKGDSIVTIAAGRLLRSPPDPRHVMPSLPAPIAELVLKLMARQREDRFSSAAETSERLTAYLQARATLAERRQSEGPSTMGSAAAGDLKPPLLTSLLSQRDAPANPAHAHHQKKQTLAVLPVLNLSTLDDDYLVENVNEDLVDALSVVPGLRVRSRGDVRQYLDANRDVREIGRALGVAVVVDASVRRMDKSGDIVRAAFRLITIEDGFQLWAKRFDRPRTEVLSIADEAATAIANALSSAAAVASAAAAAAGSPVANAESEELYLRARLLMRRGWFGSAETAVVSLKRAHELAPDDTRVQGAFALSLARVVGEDGFARDVGDQARAHATRVIERDPRNPDAKVALAILHMMNGEGHAGVRLFREVLAIAPNNISTLDWLGRIAAEVDRVPEAVLLYERIQSIDPDSVGARFQFARILGMTGDRAGSKKQLGPKPSNPSDLPGWFLSSSRDALWYRDIELAKVLAADVRTAEVSPTMKFAIEAVLALVLGEGQHLIDTLDQILPVNVSQAPRRAAFNAQLRAEFYLALNRCEEALANIAISDAHGLIDALWLAKCPLLAPVREHPSFITVQQRVAMRAARVAEAFE